MVAWGATLGWNGLQCARAVAAALHQQHGGIGAFAAWSLGSWGRQCAQHPEVEGREAASSIVPVYLAKLWQSMRPASQTENIPDREHPRSLHPLARWLSVTRRPGEE
jgi:hypothetical protein